MSFGIDQIIDKKKRTFMVYHKKRCRDEPR